MVKTMELEAGATGVRFSLILVIMYYVMYSEATLCILVKFVLFYFGTLIYLEANKDDYVGYRPMTESLALWTAFYHNVSVVQKRPTIHINSLERQ